MNIDWQQFSELVEQNSRFVLTSHVRPDADALGSELAVAEMLRSRGKQVRIINPSAAPNTLEFLDPDSTVLKFGQDAGEQDVLDTDVQVILDTSAWGQLSKLGDVIRRSQATKVVIDHHVSSDDLGAIELKDTQSEATGAMVFEMAQACGFEISERIANWLFCAIATDTGWFRFPSTTSQTMRVIAELIDFGAQPHLLYEKLYEQKSLARLRLAGVVLNRVQLAADGRLGFTVVKRSDFKETGAAPVDTENLVNECLTVIGTVAAFIAVEQLDGKVKVSFRSRVPFDVSSVAETFGGGGHKQAAGATLAGPLDDAVQRVEQTLVTRLQQLDSPTI